MKKILILICVIAVLVCFVAIFIPLSNDRAARNVERQLAAVTLPENTELVESISKAGKLVGNGNGMQYFGAILIKSDRTLEELSSYYSENLSGAMVKAQTSQKIEFIEHEKMSFEMPVDSNDYYIVYTFDESSSLFANLDIRAH